MIVPSSLRSKYLKATTRLTGVVAAAIIGIALFLKRYRFLHLLRNRAVATVSFQHP